MLPIFYNDNTQLNSNNTMNSYKIAVTHDELHAKPDAAGGLCME